MAGGFWRGQAALDAIFKNRMQDYLGGLGGQGFQDLLGTLTEQQMPFFEDVAGRYAHLGAGGGQVVPGQGSSSAFQQGFEDITSRHASNILGQALQAYTMPYQGLFGATGQVGQQYMGGKGADMGIEGFLGQLLGQVGGAFAGGAGTGLGMGMFS